MSATLKRALRATRRLGRVAGYVAAHPAEALSKAEAHLALAATRGGTEQYTQYRDGLPSIAPLNLLADPALAARPRLNVLLPGMAMKAMSGGPNTLVNLVCRMAHEGVPVRFISTDIPMDVDHGPLRRHFASLTGLPEGDGDIEITCGFDRARPLPIGENDVFFASAWWNVQMIKHALPLVRAKRFLYIIQDFEPGLYAWSTEYALALETYGLDYHAVLCGTFLAHFMTTQGIGRFADPGFIDRCAVFEPALDATRFRPEPPAPGRPRRLVFYARPQAARRNMFELGLYALRCASETGLFDGERWEFLFFGEQLPEVDLGRGNVIRSAPWLDYDGYAAMLRSSDVGLSLMLSPHPSYPPLELAACGAIAVTNTFMTKTAPMFAAVSSNIVAVEPSLEGVLGGLREAVARVRAERRDTAPIRMPSDWSDAFAQTLPTAIGWWRTLQHELGTGVA
jgi:hypothetical protein